MGRSWIACLSVVLACSGGSAFAQNGVQAPPQSAVKAGDDAASDPTGAVRSLGAVDEGGSKKDQPSVKIPDLGGEGASRPGGLPLGTTGPGR